MRTKCRHLFQDAAAAAPAQCTSGNSQPGNTGERTRAFPLSSTDAPGAEWVHYKTIKSRSA
jgi:hypothetical protein